MDKREFLQAPRRLAANRRRFIVTDHAQRRDPAAGKHPLSDRAMINCITAVNARVSEGPTADAKEVCGWKGKITSAEPGALTEIACVIVPKTKIVIVTAYEIRIFTRAPRPPPGSPDTGDDALEEDDDDGEV